MVAIVAGKGLGLLNTSLHILGEAGVLEQSILGQGSCRAIINAVSGNLVLQMQDEQLARRGLDLYAVRTYNSFGAPNDGDKDGWRWGYEQTVRFQGPGTPAQPQPGATVIRTDGESHEATYTWGATRAAFIGTDGDRCLVAFQGSAHRPLAAQAELVQNAPDMVFVVSHFSAILDEVAHPARGPQPAGKAERLRPAFERLLVEGSRQT